MEKKKLEIDNSKSQHVLRLSYFLSSSQVFQHQNCMLRRTVYWAHYVAPSEYFTHTWYRVEMSFTLQTTVFW